MWLLHEVSAHRQSVCGKGPLFALRACTRACGCPVAPGNYHGGSLVVFVVVVVVRVVVSSGRLYLGETVLWRRVEGTLVKKERALPIVRAFCLPIEEGSGPSGGSAGGRPVLFGGRQPRNSLDHTSIVQV